MAYINDNYLKLKAGYLFPEIARRVKAFQQQHPDAKIIRMGIGDVTEPLPEACVEAMHRAIDDQATRERFHGYGPEQGYEWLRNAIAGLPEHYRAVFVMYDMEGYSHEEIGSALNVPVGTSKARLSRAREKLREQLADFAGEWVQ